MLQKSGRLEALEFGVLLFVKEQVQYEQQQYVLALPENFQGDETAYLQSFSFSLFAIEAAFRAVNFIGDFCVCTECLS